MKKTSADEVLGNLFEQFLGKSKENNTKNENQENCQEYPLDIFDFPDGDTLKFVTHLMIVNIFVEENCSLDVKQSLIDAAKISFKPLKDKLSTGYVLMFNVTKNPCSPIDVLSLLG